MNDFEFKLSDQKEIPHIYLCEVDKTISGCLVKKDLSLNVKWNTFSEISFTVPRTYINLSRGETFLNPYYEKIESLRNIFVEGIGYFQIQDISVRSDGIKESKEISAHSYEVSLGQKYLNNFKVNTGEIDSIEYEENPEDIIPVRIFWPGKPERSLLNIILEKVPDWSIGHVDNEFTTVTTESQPGMNRMFDVSRESIYDFLMNDVAPTVHGVFIFDTMENAISLYTEDRAGKDTDIYISKDNLMKEVSVKYDCNDIKTSLRVSGADDEVSIRMHNFGNDSITDLSYYATENYMGRDLSAAYNSYLTTLPAKQAQYTILADEYNVLNNELTVLQTELTGLQGEESSYKNIQQTQIEAGWAEKAPESTEYGRYKENLDKLNTVISQIND